MDITENQLRVMRHTLGLDWSKKPYRNRYQTVKEDKDWNELVEKGLAAKGIKQDNECVWFWLTKQGVEFVTGKKISDKKYNDL